MFAKVDYGVEKPSYSRLYFSKISISLCLLKKTLFGNEVVVCHTNDHVHIVQFFMRKQNMFAKVDYHVGKLLYSRLYFSEINIEYLGKLNVCVEKSGNCLEVQFFSVKLGCRLSCLVKISRHGTILMR